MCVRNYVQKLPFFLTHFLKPCIYGGFFYFTPSVPHYKSYTNMIA